MSTSTLLAGFVPIREPYVHGYAMEHDGLKIEVIRCYASSWQIFCHRDGKAMRRQDSETFMSYASAVRVAKIYMREALAWMAAERD